MNMSRSKSVPALAPSRVLLLMLLLCGALLYAALAAADVANDNDPPGRVARVNLLDGHGSLQLAGSDTWIEDLVNRPLADGDKLWIESGSRAEVHIGSAVLRLGASTALQFVAIDDRTVRLRVTAGSLSVRLRELETDEVFNVETPAGNVELLDVGGYRFDVADREERARVAVWSGRARVQGAGGTQVLRHRQPGSLGGESRSARR
jgi:FecR protein